MNKLKNSNHVFLASSKPVVPGNVLTLTPIKKPLVNVTNVKK